ncbi:N/A [soil metagenome]
MIRRIYQSIHWRGTRALRLVKRQLASPRLTQADILSVLRRLSTPCPPIVMVHSSLSACGMISGGPLSVLHALRDWSQGGTLVLPTHTYCYPSQDADGRIYDPKHTDSLVGVITNAFWKQPTVVRTLHPSHSLAFEGPESASLSSGHELSATPCGRATPYERLVELDAAVLMFGATLNAYTLFHTAEDAASVPYLYKPSPLILRIRFSDGSVRPVRMLRQDMEVRRRFADMDNWAEARGLLSRFRFGQGELLWIPHSKALHEALLAALKDDPWLLVAPDSRPKDSFRSWSQGAAQS